MKFKVYSRRALEEYHTMEKHIIISVKDPRSEDVQLAENGFRLDTLRLEFSDIDKKHDKIKLSKDIIRFTPEMAIKILEFYKKYCLDVELVICQCEAGISRSAAIAAALSYVIGQPDYPFFTNFVPNGLVYHTIVREGFKKK